MRVRFIAAGGLRGSLSNGAPAPPRRKPAGIAARRAGLLLAALAPAAVPGADASLVRGVTVSCQTYGREWAGPGFERELERLAELGANWVAIHPYAAIAADGSVRSRLDPEHPPEWLVQPIEAAHRRGLAILVKPHLAYWGSPFRWRGEIDFEGPARARFHATYREWIVALAGVVRAADAFAVGTELDRLAIDEAPWRELVAAVRAVTPAKLTYAANWDSYERVPFWDALDAIGVQAYFPLVTAGGQRLPDERELRRGWERVLPPLRALAERTGKPVVFTELGYDRWLGAAREPWRSGDEAGSEAQELQRRCLAAALAALERESAWLRGAFLWKWFVGPAPCEDFRLDTPELRAELRRAWRR